MIQWGMPLVGALIGALMCRFVAAQSLRSPPPEVMRTNVEGRPVPVVLGWAVAAGALAGLVSVVLAGMAPEGCLPLVLCVHTGNLGTLLALAAVPTLGMFLAGFWDDLRGDERPRGFAGHLAAFGGGALTGGIVKLVVGGLVGLATAAIALEGVQPWSLLILIALAVALSANLINLLDRAPGRALKVFVVVAVPLAVLGDEEWRLLAAGAIGAAVVALPLDLRARAMLGDAGANALGALMGLGLAINLGDSTSSLTTAINLGDSTSGLAAAVVVLLALNLASERWSFSEVIANNRWLARMDHLGRK